MKLDRIWTGKLKIVVGLLGSKLARKSWKTLFLLYFLGFCVWDSLENVRFSRRR